MTKGERVWSDDEVRSALDALNDGAGIEEVAALVGREPYQVSWKMRQLRQAGHEAPKCRRGRKSGRSPHTWTAWESAYVLTACAFKTHRQIAEDLSLRPAQVASHVQFLRRTATVKSSVRG